MRPLRDWTVLVYQDPRSKLRQGLAEDVQSMVESRLGSEVQVVVQGGGSPDTAELDRVVIDETGVSHSETIEADTRKAETLNDFLAWGMKNYPSKKTMVVLAGHGEGFAGYATDGKSKPGTTGIGLQQLSEVLERYPSDVLVFDACLMGQAEVLHTLKDSCHYLVASSELVGEAGLPYPPILEQLGGLNPRAAAEQVVEISRQDQQAREAAGDTSGVLTMAAYDTSQAETLLKAIDATAGAALEAPPSAGAFPAFSSPGFNLEQWGEPFHHFRDLKSYAGRLQKSKEMPEEVRLQAGKLVEACERTVVAHHAEGDRVLESTGLSVYLPTDYKPEEDFGYAETSLAQNTRWDEFLAHIANR